MNKSNAHLFKPILDALIAGKTVTFRGEVLSNYAFDSNPEDYAIVEPPKPVPLTYEDMEPGCHLRFPNKPDEIAVTRLFHNAVRLESGHVYLFAEFMHAEIYRPSTRTWSPAHK